METRLAYAQSRGTGAACRDPRRNDAGHEVPWDGSRWVKLEVRGPWVARAYYKSPESAGPFHARWLVSNRRRRSPSIRGGYVEIQDRSKDLIKSGGEWISSVALENALMGHPAVAEAAVIAVPQWRAGRSVPSRSSCFKPGQTATADELRAFLAPSFAKWWLPTRSSS